MIRATEHTHGPWRNVTGTVSTFSSEGSAVVQRYPNGETETIFAAESDTTAMLLAKLVQRASDYNNMRQYTLSAKFYRRAWDIAGVRF